MEILEFVRKFKEKSDEILKSGIITHPKNVTDYRKGDWTFFFNCVIYDIIKITNSQGEYHLLVCPETSVGRWYSDILIYSYDSEDPLFLLAIEIDSLSLKVDDQVYAFFQSNKELLLNKICREIRLHYEQDLNPSFYLHDVKKILNESNIQKNSQQKIIDALTKPMLINLGIADFYLIAKSSKNLELLRFNIISNSKKIFKKVRSKLKNIKSAVVIIYGDDNTKLGDIQALWNILDKELPPMCITGFAYGIRNNIKNPEVLLLTGR